MSNKAAEWDVRGITVGYKNWTFCGSDSGGNRVAAMFTLIETGKLNDVDPRAWLADILARIADHPIKHIADLAAVELAGRKGRSSGCLIAGIDRQCGCASGTLGQRCRRSRSQRDH